MTTADERMQSYCRAIEAMETQHQRDMHHLETQIASLEKLMNTQFTAQAKAVEMANDAMHERLKLLNEFRQQMEDQAGRFATRDTVDATFNDLNRRLGSIENKAGTWPTTADVDAKLNVQVSRIGNIEERLASLDGKLIAWSAAMGIGATLVAFLLQIFNIGG